MVKCLKKIICFSTIGLFIYTGAMFGIPYYKYFALNSEVEDIMRFRAGEAEIQKSVLKKVAESGVPVKESDISITGKGEEMKTVIKWTHTVNIFDIYKKDIAFVIEAGR